MLVVVMWILWRWFVIFVFKQKTAYEMRISDWSSDVCSSDLYFYLVRMFGDVPKITENISDLGQIQTPRSPVKEIYDDIIIPDLLFAEGSKIGSASCRERVCQYV